MKYTFFKRLSLCMAILAFAQIAQGMEAPRAKLFNRHTFPVVNLGEDAKFKMTIASINKGNFENVRKALDFNPEFAKAEDSYGNTLLSFAAKQGDTKIAQLLIDRDARVNWPNKMMKTPLDLAILTGNDEMIRLLRNYGGIVYAKYIAILKPTRNYSEWMADIFRRDYIENLDLNVAPTDADKLHTTLAYVSVPMKYNDNEEEYLHNARQTLEDIENYTSNIIRSSLGSALHSSTITWKRIEPIGRFIGVSYNTPGSVKTLIDDLYSTIKQNVRNAQETYPERLDLHISIAEMNEGKLDPATVLPQPIQSGWNRLELEGPHGVSYDVTLNLPSKTGLHTEKISGLQLV